MAIARVQAASNNSTGTGTVSVTISAATANNLLVGVASVNETAADKDINTPAGWTAVSLADINATTKVRGRMFFKVAAGGETSAAFASASGTSDMAAWIIEFSGTATASPEDLANENTGTTSPSTTGAIGSPTAGAVGVAFVAINNDNNLTTPTNSYTLEGTAASTNATATARTRIGLLYNLSPGATDTGLTQGGTARSFVGQLVTFKPAGGGTAHQGAVTFQGVGNLTPTGALGATGSVTLQGVGTMTPTGSLGAKAAVTFQGVGTLTADALHTPAVVPPDVIAPGTILIPRRRGRHRDLYWN